MNTKENFFFSEPGLKKVLRDTMTRAGMGQAFFDWFVLIMRMQAILDSSFRPPGFRPCMGQEERRVQGLDYLQA